MAVLRSLRRLALGHHRGKFDFSLRITGLVLLLVPVSLTRLLIALRTIPTPHGVSPLEFLLACGAMLGFWLAALLLVAGAALLRPVPHPPRPLYS